MTMTQAVIKKDDGDQSQGGAAELGRRTENVVSGNNQAGGDVS